LHNEPTPVHVDVHLQGTTGNRVAVIVALEVNGVTNSLSSVVEPVPLATGHAVAAFSSAEAARLLLELMKKASPCMPKVNMKGTTNMTGEMAWTGSYEGASSLHLDEGGSFAGVIGVRFTSSPIATSDSMCTIAMSNPNSTLAVEGHYSALDGNLKFTKVVFGGFQGLITATCIFAGDPRPMTVTRPVPPYPGVNGASDRDVRIALRNGARAIFPIPSPLPGMTMVFTMDLTYEERELRVGRIDVPSNGRISY
jgi:hypothetical protein